MDRAWLKIATVAALVWMMAAGAFSARFEQRVSECCQSILASECPCGCACVSDAVDSDDAPTMNLASAFEVVSPTPTLAGPVLIELSLGVACRFQEGYLLYRPRAPDLGRAPPFFL